MNASLSVICYKYKTLSNGEHPLMLRVHKDGKRKLLSIGLSVHPNHWNFTKNEPKPKCPNKDLINKIILDKKAEYQKKILEFSSEQKDYTALSLVENKKTRYAPKTVIDFYEELIKGFKDAGRTGNKSIYTNSLNSLKAFTHNKLNILFSDIDVDWLKQYEQWQRSNRNKETTISLQFRTLRSAYNKAIESRATSDKFYPFKEFNINKFNTKTNKRALSKEEIMKIITTETINATYMRQLARDIFKFSYLCAGIPFVDIANLTMENITRQRFSYVRQKTHGEIKGVIGKEAKEIIEKYAYHRKDALYLFPVLDARVHKTPQQKANRIHKVCAQINRALKELAQELEISGNLTTYVARHSFATVLKRSGVDIALISELMGHSDLSTTQIYLDSFDEKQINTAMQKLL